MCDANATSVIGYDRYYCYLIIRNLHLAWHTKNYSSGQICKIYLPPSLIASAICSANLKEQFCVASFSSTYRSNLISTRHTYILNYEITANIKIIILLGVLRKGAGMICNLYWQVLAVISAPGHVP